MKRLKIFSAALTVAFAAVGCGNSNSYTIHGTVDGGGDIRYDSVFVMTGDVRNAAAVVDNKFVLEGSVESPIITQLEMIYVDPESGVALGTTTLPVVVEPGTISVEITGEDITIGGTPQNDAIQGFNDAADEWEERQGEWDEAVALVKEFVFANAQTQAAVYGLTTAQNVLEDDDLMEVLNACSEQVKQHPEVMPIVERMAILERTCVGQPFVDFEVDTSDGVVKFSDYVGKGQVVLVDFWASWCSPCRAEIPNVKAVYKEFKDKGLVVVGVPTSDRPEDTRRAVEQDGIPFAQIIGSERQAIGAVAYGVRGIPHLILFDADGTILGRGQNVESLREALTKALQ